MAEAVAVCLKRCNSRVWLQASQAPASVVMVSKTKAISLPVRMMANMMEGKTVARLLMQIEGSRWWGRAARNDQFGDELPRLLRPVVGACLHAIPKRGAAVRQGRTGVGDPGYRQGIACKQAPAV